MKTGEGPVDARFSLQHIQANLMVEGDLNFHTLMKDNMSSPLFKEARAKVRVHTHSDWARKRMSTTGKATITTKDGKERR